MSTSTFEGIGRRRRETPALMKAAVVHSFDEPLRIEEVETPVPGAGEILVRIEASGSATPTSTPRTATGPSSRPRRSSRATRASASSSSSAQA